jgi:hypothetical protein
MPENVRLEPWAEGKERRSCLTLHGWGNIMRSLHGVIYFVIFHSIQQLIRWSMHGLQKKGVTRTYTYQTLWDLERGLRMMYIRGEFVRVAEFTIAYNSHFINYERWTPWFQERTQFVAGVVVRAELDQLRKRFPMNVVEQIWRWVFDSELFSITDEHLPVHQWFHSIVVFMEDAEFTGEQEWGRNLHMGCAKDAWQDMVADLSYHEALNFVRSERRKIRAERERRKEKAKEKEKEKERESSCEGVMDKEGEGEAEGKQKNEEKEKEMDGKRSVGKGKGNVHVHVCLCMDMVLSN